MEAGSTLGEITNSLKQFLSSKVNKLEPLKSYSSLLEDAHSQFLAHCVNLFPRIGEQLLEQLKLNFDHL